MDRGWRTVKLQGGAELTVLTWCVSCSGRRYAEDTLGYP